MPPLLCSRPARLFPIVNIQRYTSTYIRTNPTGRLLHNLPLDTTTNTNRYKGVQTTEHVRMNSLWSFYATSKVLCHKPRLLGCLVLDSQEHDRPILYPAWKAVWLNDRTLCTTKTRSVEVIESRNGSQPIIEYLEEFQSGCIEISVRDDAINVDEKMRSGSSLLACNTWLERRLAT